MARLIDWKNDIEKTKKEWEYFVMVSVAYQAVVDLLGKVRDRRKIELLEPILAPISKISDFSDPAGVNCEAFECADMALKSLYRQLEFEA